MPIGVPIPIVPDQLQADIPVRIRDRPSIGQGSRNMVPSRGALSSRQGWQKAPQSVSGTIIGLAAMQGGDGSVNAVIATTTTLYRSLGPGYTGLTDLRGANPVLTATDENAGVFCAVLDTSNAGVVHTNNADPPLFWSTGASSWTILTLAPAKARTVASVALGVAGTRIMFGNTWESGTHYPSRVRWSTLNNQATYPALAYADLLATPDSIVAIKAFNRTALAIYKDSSQWIATGQGGSDSACFTFELVDRQAGPIGANAVCDGPNNTQLYLGRDGALYQFDGTAAYRLLSLADVTGFVFDPAKSENNCLFFDRYRNCIEGMAWTVVNTTTTGLIAISSYPAG